MTENKNRKINPEFKLPDTHKIRELTLRSIGFFWRPRMESLIKSAAKGNIIAKHKLYIMIKPILRSK